MRRLSIEHTTVYRYPGPVSLQPHKLLLRPREGHDIRIESSRLAITPAHRVKWQRDVYGNSVGLVSFLEPASELSITSEVIIRHYEEAPLDFLVADYAVQFPFQYDPAERVELMAYEIPVFAEDTAALRAWAQRFWRPGQIVQTYVLLDTINKAIARDIGYLQREQPGVQSPRQTLAGNRGSCRDLATLFIEACRFFGLAARFVSGYLHSPGSEQEGATHAWSEVYLPGAGWKGFDSTSGLVTGTDHIAVAVSRHPESIPPISGAFVGPADPPPVMEVDVDVRLKG